MLNQQQIAMVGVFGSLPTTTTTFFMRRIAKGKIPFITNATTISFEEITKELKKAKILQRGAEYPVAKLNGSIIKSVTPEVLKTSIPFTAEDSLNRAPGQITYINGQAVDNSTYERDRRIQMIKNNLDITREEISASVFLTGEYKSPDTDNVVQFSFPSPESIPKTNIKEWSIWISTKINEFAKNSKAQVSEILVGENVFYKILEDYNKSSNKVIPADIKRESVEDNQYELCIYAFGFKFVMIPKATNPKGEEIDTKNKIIIYNDNAFLPTYAGLVNVENGIATMEAIDVLIRETSANEKTGQAETLGESGYCPIIPNPTLIKVFEVTGL